MSGVGIGAFAGGFTRSMDMADRRKERDERRALAEQAMQSGQNPQGAVSLARGAIPPGAAAPAMQRPGHWGDNVSLLDLVDATEGAGNYSTLFGHSQRDGGQFAGVDVSSMTLDQLKDFTNPSGPYGQWVKRANPKGVVATPLGRFQIVGTTLRGAAQELNLPGDTRFDQNTQHQLFQHLAGRRLAGARTPEAARAAMRAEWDGFSNIPDHVLDRAIANYRMPQQQVAAAPMGAIRQGGPS